MSKEVVGLFKPNELTESPKGLANVIKLLKTTTGKEYPIYEIDKMLDDKGFDSEQKKEFYAVYNS